MHSEGMQSCRRAEQGQGMVKHGRAAQGEIRREEGKHTGLRGKKGEREIEVERSELTRHKLPDG